MKYTENQIITAMKGTGGIVSQIINNLSKLDSSTTISRQGIYDRIDKSATLKEAYQAEQERIGDIVETGFFKALQNEQEWAMKEWFRYKGYTRGYVQKQQVDANITVDPTKKLLEKYDLQIEGEDVRETDSP